MVKIIKLFANQHPYLAYIALIVTASLIGITVEWLINRDFVNNIWGALMMIIIGVIGIYYKQKKKS
ncbi:hypothetical protein LSA01_07600 [Latilactobacillus sakei]|uniref:hypothetical protein n=1 Tax=Latilactobacillus sakei TaxID=1599 RepID=UPI000469AA85|nr:hypothetical protein [Latilactobacillus sakei]KRK69872.1 hypothetical protein FD49_GL000566 [Latilactobacillus sakei subsp. sakei DSM 20017 = JCM 1157]QPG03037.1 hypothetical protein INH01_08690 [Latilactobacillus sakei]QVQ49324.1 hypothetical protein KIK01_02100 [Latilactobacillus sakei subsp. sakei]TDG60217.1 hypothetical protein C5L17_001727 [Latilactobacillus sakei subsp. sakei]USF95654.1 hypothetical protein A4W82_01810 [Latilactobacillus sakei]